MGDLHNRSKETIGKSKEILETKGLLGSQSTRELSEMDQLPSKETGREEERDGVSQLE